MRPLFAIVAISLSLSHLVFAETLSPFNLGGSFPRSSREPKFVIKLHTDDSPYHPEDDQESMVMPNSNGLSYMCYLPKIEKAKSGKTITQHNISSMVVESVKTIRLKTPDELLEDLKDQCFVRQEGWWSYEFCYQKKIRQLHIEEERVVQEFILGEFDAEATADFNQNLSDIFTLKDPRSKDASQVYHPHQYKNGTLCDLTNQPRETEVRFVCSEPRAMFSSITELSTCKYALTIRSPVLCQHPLFLAERPVWYTIHCNELPKESHVAKMEEVSDNDAEIVTVTDSKDPIAE